jgi:hypothetical protein
MQRRNLPSQTDHVIRAALAVLVAFLAAGCGHGSGQREAVAVYIARVNSVEVALTSPLQAITTANRDFARHQGAPAAISRDLRQAAMEVDALARRLAALNPPSDAVHLQPLLVEFARGEAALGREVASLATFLPAFSQTLRPLRPAGITLERTLKSNAQAQVKAAVLDTYAVIAGGVIGQLRGLHPPHVSASLYNDQVATLEHVRDSGRSLARALRDKRTKDLPTLLRRFNLAAVGNQSIAAQKAQIAAVRAYNDRIRGLDRLQVRISRAQTQLDKLK